MAISPILLKGIAGVGAVGVTTIGVVYREEIKGLFSSSIDYQKLMTDVGIGNDCKWQSENNSAECSLDEAKLKAIKFHEKTGDLTIEGQKSLKLKVEKTNDTTNFHKGLKFTFINEKDTKIKAGGDDSNPIVLAALSNKEFKLKENGNSYSLEPAWDISKLAAKVGLACEDKNSTITCKPSPAINVFKDSTSYSTGKKYSSDSESATITLSKDSKGHNQGFKLKVSANITLKDGTGTLNQLTNEKKSYEIGIRKVNNQDTWFLIEKDEQQIKEELVGVTCTAATPMKCTPIKGRTISGVDGDTSNISFTKTSETDTNKYPGGFKYAKSGDNKNYKIDTASNEYQFSEVNN